MGSNVPLPVVQKSMGHRSAIMTMRYAHADDSQRVDAVSKLVPIPAPIPGGESGISSVVQSTREHPKTMKPN
jgi:hypothetical protein